MREAEQPQTDAPAADGAALARGWLDNSPFVAHLGIAMEQMEPDRAVLSMPFADSLPTVGDVVHGGAISSLTDTAAAAAGWSGAEGPERPRASPGGLAVKLPATRPRRGSERGRPCHPPRGKRPLCLRGKGD